MMGSRTRLGLTLVVLAGLSTAVFVDVESLSSGITEEKARTGGATGTLVQSGCSCHNPAPGNATAVLEGVPSFYVPLGGGSYESQDYNLTVRILGGPTPNDAGNKGGFNLQVTGGSLKAPADATEAGFVDVAAKEATHKSAGDRNGRTFRLVWTSPERAGADVQFILTVNSVNGNGQPDPADAWNRLTLTSMGSQRLGAAAAEEGHPATKLGVNFLAYWVGVVSFIVLFVVLGITFFVLRYGESGHWASWKDRAAKDKGVEPLPGESTRDWSSWVIGILVLAAAGFATWQLWGQNVAGNNLTAFTFMLFVAVGSLAGAMVLAIYYMVARIRNARAEIAAEKGSEGE
jgi:hypothetical protein